ncbi:hypothetical protein ABH920_009370 [Catenulispora sp. EB89]|uniref:hypothetical protein n=1 Tax=Catenulispora sp. EB89 TaxID=3156257 RepID=UPI0035157966
MVANDSAFLVVTRDAAFISDVFRAHDVMVDGVGLAKVKRGKSVRIPVPPGRHQVQMRVDWCLSRPLEIEIPQGGEVRLACGSNRKSGSALKHVIENRLDYLWLRAEDQSSAADT